MKLLDKLRDALFDDDDDEVEEKSNNKSKEIKTVNEDKIVKKIDVDKTTSDTLEDDSLTFKVQDYNTVEKPKAPIIFDDEDFLSDTRELSFKEVPKKEEKILYGGYENKDYDRNKEKFHLSPVISPVYGVLDKNYVSTSTTTVTKDKSLDHLFVEERKKEVTFDTIRQKAFGDALTKTDEDDTKEDDNPLLYEMEDHDDRPGIEKITIGDAEEYFDDLGLEYEVDYKDIAKSNMTRSEKNKELADIVDEEIKGDKKIEEELKEKEKDKDKDKTKEKEKNKEGDKDNSKKEDAEEKSLYDLIDMMYESKED